MEKEFKHLDKIILSNLKKFNLTDEALEYAEIEYNRGLDYYHSRIKNLSISGLKALDAGCGVGNWSIALSNFFKEVISIDLNKDRLKCARSVSKKINVNLFLF